MVTLCYSSHKRQLLGGGSLAGLGLSALATGGKTLDKMIKILCGGDMRVGEGGTLFYWKNTEYFGGWLAGWL